MKHRFLFGKLTRPNRQYINQGVVMKNNSFKSAEHSLNHQVLQISKKNKKQPTKIYNKEELEAFAKSRGMTVSTKPRNPAPAPFVGNIDVNEEVDYSVLPEEVLKLIGK